MMCLCTLYAGIQTMHERALCLLVLSCVCVCMCARLRMLAHWICDWHVAHSLSLSIYDEMKQNSFSLTELHRIYIENVHTRLNISYRGIALLRFGALITFNSSYKMCLTVIMTVCILLFIFACTLAIIYFEILEFSLFWKC